MNNQIKVPLTGTSMIFESPYIYGFILKLAFYERESSQSLRAQADFQKAETHHAACCPRRLRRNAFLQARPRTSDPTCHLGEDPGASEACLRHRQGQRGHSPAGAVRPGRQVRTKAVPPVPMRAQTERWVRAAPFPGDRGRQRGGGGRQRHRERPCQSPLRPSRISPQQLGLT